MVRSHHLVSAAGRAPGRMELPWRDGELVPNGGSGPRSARNILVATRGSAIPENATAMKIRAAIVRKSRSEFAIEPVDLGAPQSHEVVVQVVAAGMCHTDLSVRDGHIPFPPLPCVLGHEGAGIVAAVGAEVTAVAVGDRVAMSFAACGRCDKCAHGEPAYCRNFFPLNFLGTRMDGSHTHHQGDGALQACFFGQSSFATHALVHERNLVKIPDDVPLELMGPLGCGLQTGAGAVLNYLKPAPGSSIAVFGVGAVGLAAVMAAKVAGCGTIIAVDIHENRLSLARELGATHTVNSDRQSAHEGIQQVCQGGVNYSVEATGIPAVMAAAIESLAKPGHAALLGAARGGVKVEIDMLAFAGGNTIKALTEGDAVPAAFIPTLIALYRAGKFPFDRLVQFYELDAINQAARDAESGAVIKPIIRMPR